MKTKICVCVMVAFILMGSITSNAEEFFNDDTLNNIMKRMVQINREVLSLIESIGHPNDIIAKVDELHDLERETRRQCDIRGVFASVDLPWGPNEIGQIEYRQCLIAFEEVASMSAIAHNTAAKYCATLATAPGLKLDTQKALKGIAKLLYREVITTYTGHAYISYVKEAEFGLEDLKDKE